MHALETAPDEVDYLVVGAGAMGLAFADALHTARPELSIALVDSRAAPGGHWNDAYPFVTLHQPAAFYGVNALPLGAGGEDLSTRSEILAYFERALKRMTDSGRVHFLPMCRYEDGHVRSLLYPETVRTLHARERVVNAGYMNVQVPATQPPPFPVDADVAVAIPGDLARLDTSWRRYLIVGAGKTAIDAILFLLDRGVPAERVRWVMPNDSWLWNRAKVQTGRVVQEFQLQLTTLVEAESVDDLYLRLEAAGSLFRLSSEVMPTKWRCATVSEAEFQQLLAVKDVVRLGRVQSVTSSSVRLADGELPLEPDTLVVHCAANGLQALPKVPIYSDGAMTLQPILMCQQVFSAAVLARVALLDMDDAQRNLLLQPVPHPEQAAHLVDRLVATFDNLIGLNRHLPLWLRRSRLNLMAHEPLWRYLLAGLDVQRKLPAARAARERLAGAA